MKFTILAGALSWILFILLTPVTIPILATFWLTRFLALSFGKILKLKNNGVGIEESVTSLDSLFTVDAFSNREHGANAVALLLEGPIDVNKLQEKLKQVLKIKGYDRLHSLRAVKWLGYSFWTSASSNPAVSLKSSFDLKDHFLVEKNEICGDLELDKYLAKYMKHPFPKDRPRWDIMYIANFKQNKNQNSEVKSVIVLRFHHITGDGVSYFNFLHEITDDVSPWKEIPIGKATAINHKQVLTKKQNVPIGDNKLISSIQNLYWTPLLFMHQVQEFNFHKDFLTKKKVSQDWTLLRTEVDFESFKAIRRQHFGHNPLGILATQNWIAAGALREHYKRELGILGPQTPAARVITSLPWVSTTEKLNISKFRNEFTTGIYKMPLNEPSRLKRRIAINEDCRINFKFRLPQVYRNVLPLYGLLPFVIANAIMGHNVGAPALLSNVVGPKTLIYLGGKKVVNLWTIGGLQWFHGGMTNAFCSYNGQMSLTFLFNNDLIQSGDTAALAQDFRNEVKSIQEF